MPRVTKQESREFLRHLANIRDEKVRYFLMMLTDAIGQAQTSERQTPRANASPAHFADIARRVNTKT